MNAIDTSLSQSAPADLTYVREIADGDAELEQEMLLAFIAQSDAAVSTLNASCAAGNHDAWRDASHALKGGARTMGATKLAGLAERGQHFSGGCAERQALLQQIAAAYDEVKAYLALGPGASAR